jgi:CheY-like chemotaxis protein
MRKIRILLADDDKEDRSFFNEAIKQTGLDIDLVTVSNGQELLSYLQKRDVILPDLIFLDLNMPLMGGIESLKMIRRCSYLKDLSVAIYSTSRSEKDMEDALINGANIYINKPSDFNVLKAHLYRVITTNHQYDGLRLSRENFLMVL